MDSLEENKIFVQELKKIYPNVIFRSGSRFRFHPPKTIYYVSSAENFKLLILHELGHALINKNDYKTDIERLKIEQKAWTKAKEITISLNLDFDESFAEQKLDSYRDWLHKKSTCKKCGLTRFETPDGVYHCPHCDLL